MQERGGGEEEDEQEQDGQRKKANTQFKGKYALVLMSVSRLVGLNANSSQLIIHDQTFQASVGIIGPTRSNVPPRLQHQRVSHAQSSKNSTASHRLPLPWRSWPRPSSCLSVRRRSDGERCRSPPSSCHASLYGPAAEFGSATMAAKKKKSAF